MHVGLNFYKPKVKLLKEKNEFEIVGSTIRINQRGRGIISKEESIYIICSEDSDPTKRNIHLLHSFSSSTLISHGSMFVFLNKSWG
jgi:hypothetical protein